MNIIARTFGPVWSDGINRLITGKSYKIVTYSLYDNQKMKWIEYKLKEGELIYLPKEPYCYIQVVSERGIVESFWNDYFLSTKEMRKFKIKNLL